MNPLVSILINNYNYGRFLREAIDSALAQTYSPIEVVVVDDGSTDHSIEIIQEYGTKIIPVLKKNGGQASAFNAGFARSRGAIIMFLDSDDYLTSRAAEKVVSLCEKGAQVVHHRLQVVDGQGKPLGYAPIKSSPLGTGNVLPVLLHNGRYEFPTTSGLAYSRPLLEKLLPMDEIDFRICADAWLIFQVPFLAPIFALDESVACYRVHDSNAWGANWPGRLTTRKKLEAFVRVLDLNYFLIKRQAARCGVTIQDTSKWENRITLRSRLLLGRLGSAPAGSLSNWTLYWRALEKIDLEPHTPWVGVEQRLMMLIILIAPKSILRRLYPNIF